MWKWEHLVVFSKAGRGACIQMSVEMTFMLHQLCGNMSYVQTQAYNCCVRFHCLHLYSVEFEIACLSGLVAVTPPTS